MNSNLERVLAALKETIRLKRARKSKIRILCGFIVMKHNEHEIEAFKEKMEELGVDDITIIDACVRDLEQAEKFLRKLPAKHAKQVSRTYSGVSTQPRGCAGH